MNIKEYVKEVKELMKYSYDLNVDYANVCDLYNVIYNTH